MNITVKSTTSIDIDLMLNDLVHDDLYSGVMFFCLSTIEEQRIINQLSHSGKTPLVGCTVAALSDSNASLNNPTTAVAIYFKEIIDSGHTKDMLKYKTATAFTFSIHDNELEQYLRDLTAFGGLAADYWEFSSQRIFLSDQTLLQGSVSMIVDMDIYSKSGCSWQTIPNSKAVVTRSKDNVVYEINSLPAIDYYNRFIGEVELLGAFPIKTPWGNRTVLGGGENDGSLLYTGPIPEGTEIELLNVDPSDLLPTVETICDGHPECNNFALMISCCAREMILQLDVVNEAKILSNYFPNSVILYIYGEIMPVFLPKPGSRLENEYAVCISCEK